MLCAAVSADSKARNAAMFGRTMPAKFAGGYARYFLGPPGGGCARYARFQSNFTDRMVAPRRSLLKQTVGFLRHL